MYNCLCCGRRIQTYLKLIAFALIAILYLTFLFRESINAFEQNKDKLAAISSIGYVSSDLGNALEISVAAAATELKAIKPLKFPKQRNHQFKKDIDELETPIKLPLSTLNPVYEYSEEIHSVIEKEMEKRRYHLMNVCKQYHQQNHNRHHHHQDSQHTQKQQGQEPEVNVEQQQQQSVLCPPNAREFFLSPGHNLAWCNVFKAASSTWLYYFNILSGYDIKYLLRTREQPLELARKMFPRPDTSELLEALPSAVSFLFVREPFERIVSAYRDKLENGRNTFYKPLGLKILKMFHKKHKHYKSPTFNEFIKYLIYQHNQSQSFDEHWTPVYKFCTPCCVNFNIIGKVETFQRDSEFIIRQAGLESLLLGKIPKNKLRKIGNQSMGTKTDELMAKYFSEIDRKTLDELLNIYRMDFDLFDYDYKKYYNLVQQDMSPPQSIITSQETSTVLARMTTVNNNNTFL